MPGKTEWIHTDVARSLLSPHASVTVSVPLLNQFGEKEMKVLQQGWPPRGSHGARGGGDGARDPRGRSRVCVQWETLKGLFVCLFCYVAGALVWWPVLLLRSGFVLKLRI